MGISSIVRHDWVPASRLDTGELMPVGRVDVGDKQTGARYATLYWLTTQQIGQLRRIVRQASPGAGRVWCPTLSPKLCRTCHGEAGRIVGCEI
jgi:hypothetical protein